MQLRGGHRRGAPCRCRASCRRRSRSAWPRPRPTGRASTRSPAAAGRRRTPAPRAVVELRHRGQAYRLHGRPDRPRAPPRAASTARPSRLGVRRVGAYERRLELGGATYRTLISAQGADLLVEVDGRPAPRRPRRRRHRAQPRTGDRRVHAGRPRRRGGGRRRGRRGREHEDGDVARRAVPRPRPAGTRRPQRPGRRARAARAARAARRGGCGRRGGRARRLHRVAAAGARRARTSSGSSGRARLRRRRRRGERIVGDLRGNRSRSLRSSRPSTACSGSSRTCTRSPGRGSDDEEAEGEAGRSPQEHLHAFLRSLDAKAEGLPDDFVEQLPQALATTGSRASTARRRWRPPATACTSPSSGRARRRAPCSRSSTGGSSRCDALAGIAGADLRDVLDRLAAATAGRDPVLADLAREVRFALLRRARDRGRARRGLRRGGGRPGGARGRPGAPPTARRASTRSSPARSRSPRRLIRRLADASPAAQRALLETDARRFYRVRSLEPFAETTVGGHRLITSRYRHEGPARNLATAFVEPVADLAGRPPGRRRLGPGARRPTSWPSRTSTSLAEPAAARDELAERVTAMLVGVDLPPNVHRIVVGTPAPGRGRALSAMTCSPSAAGDGRLGRGRRAARAAPDDVARACVSGRLSRVRARAAARRRGRLPVPRRRAHEPEGRAAVRAGRGARPHAACATPTGASPRCPSSSAMLVEALEAIRARSGPPQAEPPAAVEPRPAARLARDRPDARRRSARSSSGWRPSTAGLGIEMVVLRGRDARGRRRRARPRAALLHARRGSGVVIEVDDPPSRAAAAARRGHAAGSSPRAGAACCTRPRSSSCWRRRARTTAAGQPAGQFVEHDLDARRPARRRSTGRRRRTRPASSSA